MKIHRNQDLYLSNQAPSRLTGQEWELTPGLLANGGPKGLNQLPDVEGLGQEPVLDGTVPVTQSLQVLYRNNQPGEDGTSSKFSALQPTEDLAARPSGKSRWEHPQARTCPRCSEYCSEPGRSCGGRHSQGRPAGKVKTYLLAPATPGEGRSCHFQGFDLGEALGGYREGPGSIRVISSRVLISSRIRSACSSTIPKNSRTSFSSKG